MQKSPASPSQLFKWPMIFGLKPSSRAYVSRGRFSYDNSVEINQPRSRVFDAFVATEGGTQWIPMFLGVQAISGTPGQVGFVFDESFLFMSVRVRIAEIDPGKSVTMSIDRCSMPLASEMVEFIEFESIDGGRRTRMRWRIQYDPLWWVRPGHALARLFFVWLFRSATRQFGEYMDPKTQTLAQHESRA